MGLAPRPPARRPARRPRLRPSPAPPAPQIFGAERVPSRAALPAPRALASAAPPTVCSSPAAQSASAPAPPLAAAAGPVTPPPRSERLTPPRPPYRSPYASPYRTPLTPPTRSERLPSRTGSRASSRGILRTPSLDGRPHPAPAPADRGGVYSRDMGRGNSREEGGGYSALAPEDPPTPRARRGAGARSHHSDPRRAGGAPSPHPLSHSRDSLLHVRDSMLHVRDSVLRRFGGELGLPGRGFGAAEALDAGAEAAPRTAHAPAAELVARLTSPSLGALASPPLGANKASPPGRAMRPGPGSPHGWRGEADDAARARTAPWLRRPLARECGALGLVRVGSERSRSSVVVAAFSPDGGTLLCGEHGGRITLFRAHAQGRPASAAAGHSRPGSSSWLSAAGSERMPEEAPYWQEEGSFRAHDAQLWGAAFSLDSRLIYTVGEDDGVRVLPPPLVLSGHAASLTPY